MENCKNCGAVRNKGSKCEFCNGLYKTDKIVPQRNIHSLPRELRNESISSSSGLPVGLIMAGTGAFLIGYFMYKKYKKAKKQKKKQNPISKILKLNVTK
jgi:hypothetical protein